MICTQAYFAGYLDFPNLTVEVGGVTDLSNSTELDRAITIYEPEFLRLILGELYADYLSDETTKWDEFKALLIDASLLISPIANYVFFKHYPHMLAQNTGVGVAYNKAENQMLDSRPRLMGVWNNMVDYLYKDDGVLDYLDENYSTLETDELSLPSYIFYPYASTPFRAVNIYGL